jgi:argininosuccinate lyase
MTKKLWDTNNNASSDQISRFLSSDDIELDKFLFTYDIDATIAHINALSNIKIIKKTELTKLKKSLKQLRKEFINGKFKLTNDYEDCHSAIEFYLTNEHGDLGKKVHTGRSRNDQVAIAMRLFAKDQLLCVKNMNIKIAASFLEMAQKHSNDPMPGYTHMQRAMPSSWGLWFSAYAESFMDNVDLISYTSDWINNNPLGTAAGYGVKLPLDRKLVSEELGFNRLQLNSMYVQNSRGKYEMQILSALKQPMFDVRKFSWDMSLFLSQEFNLLKINKKYLTGSSIMPNKNNPDVIELLRANYAILAGQSSELENLISLPSGYHRDLQLTKKSLVESFQTVMKSLEILPDLIKSIVIDKELSNSFIDDEMRMTDRVYDLVAKGTPFRDAYNIIKSSEVSNAVTKGNKTNSSEGSPFNLNLNKLQKRLNKQKKLK